MNLLITGAWQDAKQHFDSLREMGHQIHFQQYEKDPLTVDEEWVEGIICNGFFLYHDIRRFKHLRYIQLTSAGYDRVPMKYVEDHQIEIHNARGVYSIPMAEWAVMNILNIYKNTAHFFENQKNKLWEKDRSLLELTDKRICIVGYGSVGKEVAKRLYPFGVEITVVNRSPVLNEYVERWVPFDQIDRVLPEMDIVILCLALTDETSGMFDEHRINRMKNQSVLVNMSRGKLVDEQALTRCLNTEKLRGVALDVFENEPLSAESTLWSSSKVIISPHNSFVSDKVQDRMNRLITANLEDE